MVRTKSGARKRVVPVVANTAESRIVDAVEEVGNEEESDDGAGSYYSDSDGDADEIDGEEVDGEHIEVEQNAAENLETHFGNIAAEDADEDSEDSGDECWKEDLIPEPISDEEEEGQKSPHSDDPEDGDEDLVLGKFFNSADDFKKALLRYSLKTRYDVKLYISNRKKLGAVCSVEESTCPWRVYCSYEKRKRKLQIKVYESKHTCIRSGYSKLLNSSTIASLFEDKLRGNPRYKPAEMVAEIKSHYNLIVTVHQCRKAKAKLYRARRKAHEEQFGKIWNYEAELQKSNPGTTIDIETTPGPNPGSTQRFYRIYICFESQRTAWTRFCRPIIGLDGAFLKWDVKGQLIAAVGRDGDNRIFPIAWAVVEIENDTNWDWFLVHLKRDLGLGDGLNFTVISDKQKGLVNAVKTQLPEAEHRMCARHILNNWKKASTGMEAEILFWKIARSYNLGDFADRLEEMRRLNPLAHEKLLETHPETWSRAFFKVGSCCGDILNNLSESFNKTIKEARSKPLLDLLEDIRRQCMVRTAKRSVIANRLKTQFTKNAHKQIEESIQKSRGCVRYMSTSDMHEVVDNGCAYRVDTRARTCGCLKWQINGIPCEHAASVIIGSKLKIEDFVSEYFTTTTWQQTYAHGIQPVEGMKLWPRVNRLPVLPPPNRLGKPGRPSNHSRRKSVGETSSRTKLSRAKRIMTCSNCKEEGHNKKGCKNASAEPVPKRRRGRPSKTPEVSSSQTGSQVGGSQPLSQVSGSQSTSQASTFR